MPKVKALVIHPRDNAPSDVLKAGLIVTSQQHRYPPLSICSHYFCICMYVRVYVCPLVLGQPGSLKTSPEEAGYCLLIKPPQTQHIILSAATKLLRPSFLRIQVRIQYNTLILQHPSQCFFFLCRAHFLFPPTLKPRQRQHPPNLPRNAF